MRPGNQSNKRMRGRGRKGPNPLTRTYESNGPDVKIRGTALHIAEKYQQLARDAQASGDRVMSENYFQHAEHYLRIVATAQQGQPGAVSLRNDDDQDYDGEGQVASTPQRPERPERRERSNGGSKDRENRQPSVDPDSPQPFIDNMPVIDDSGQVNGHAKSAEAPADDAQDDGDKPRRRVRGTRGRGVKRDGEDAPAEAASSEEADAEAAPAKPKRRTTRRKVAEQPAEAEAVPAGE